MDLNVLIGAPRGFELLTDSQFEQILKEARANENYIVD